MIPLFSSLPTSCLLILSKTLKVEIKKVTKQKITMPVSTMMSKFFIYFFNLRLKNINNPTIVGGHKPIKMAFSKFPSTK